jgi:hypothetical protein
MNDAEMDITIRLLGILRPIALAANNIPLLVMADDACAARGPLAVDACVEEHAAGELYAAVALATKANN